jgi:hypothetical protein
VWKNVPAEEAKMLADPHSVPIRGQSHPEETARTKIQDHTADVLYSVRKEIKNKITVIIQNEPELTNPSSITIKE